MTDIHPNKDTEYATVVRVEIVPPVRSIQVIRDVMKDLPIHKFPPKDQPASQPTDKQEDARLTLETYQTLVTKLREKGYYLAEVDKEDPKL